MEDATSRPPRTVVVRPVAAGDWSWLCRAGLSPELIGVQYHWLEAPLQLLIAPGRCGPFPPGPRCVIEVDGRRAGYIGRNPLSGNLEYFLQPWARGDVGVAAVTAFLRDHRDGDRPRAFFVSSSNERSRRTLDRAFAALGWVEGEDFTTRRATFGLQITVGGGPRPVPTERGRPGPLTGQNGV